MREGRLEDGWWREVGWEEGNDEGIISQALGVGVRLVEIGGVAMVLVMRAWDFLFRRLSRLSVFLLSGVVIEVTGSVVWVDGMRAVVLDFFGAGVGVFCEEELALRFSVEVAGKDVGGCSRQLPLAYLPARGEVGMAGVTGFRGVGSVSRSSCSS